MSNKTEVLSFDNVFKQMKDDAKPMLDLMGCPELLGDILNDIDTNRRRFKIFYDAGKKYEQDEIDELKMANHNLSVMAAEAESYSEHWKYERDKLQKRVKELELINFDSELHFDAAKEHIDHLQKRIDDCIKAMDESICDIDCGTIYGILTGDNHE